MISETRATLDGGASEQTVVVSQLDVPGRLDVQLPRIVSAIQAAGLQVTNVNYGAADPYHAYLTVSAPPRSPGERSYASTEALTPRSALPQMRELVEAGRYADAFGLRYSLGVVVTTETVDRPTAFWVNAYGAISGFRIGADRLTSGVMSYAGNADAYVDRTVPAEAATMDLVDSLAFQSR